MRRFENMVRQLVLVDLGRHSLYLINQDLQLEDKMLTDFHLPPYRNDWDLTEENIHIR
jgi:hypothetical protein